VRYRRYSLRGMTGEEEWRVWPAPIRSGHIESSSLKQQHAKTFETLRQEAAKNNQKAIHHLCCTASATNRIVRRVKDSGQHRAYSQEVS
jgi:hypothetical protein